MEETLGFRYHLRTFKPVLGFYAKLALAGGVCGTAGSLAIAFWPAIAPIVIPGLFIAVAITAAYGAVDSDVSRHWFGHEATPRKEDSGPYASPIVNTWDATALFSALDRYTAELMALSQQMTDDQENLKASLAEIRRELEQLRGSLVRDLDTEEFQKGQVRRPPPTEVLGLRPSESMTNVTMAIQYIVEEVYRRTTRQLLSGQPRLSRTSPGDIRDIHLLFDKNWKFDIALAEKRRDALNSALRHELDINSVNLYLGRNIEQEKLFAALYEKLKGAQSLHKQWNPRLEKAMERTIITWLHQSREYSDLATLWFQFAVALSHRSDPDEALKIMTSAVKAMRAHR